MPLLGRHKSLGGAAGSATSSASQTAAAASATSTPATTTGKRAVCESPLFGIRRQLPTGSGSAGSTNEQSSSSSAAAAAAGAQEGELSSVPQQITRQQIHYAFSIMDANKDGMIELRELSQMLANLGVPIDEAILAHIMLSVSKRGDHRISETEFLNWIAHVIQVSDGPPSSRPDQAALASSTAVGRAKRPVSRDSTGARVARSSTASSSLAAQPSEAAVAARTRRGSGSGLALMRSLSGSATSNSASQSTPSSSAANSQQQPSTTSGSSKTPASSSNTPPTRRPSTGAATTTKRTPKATATANTTAEPTAESEARNDLKAAFCVFDLDGDGFITLDEVRAGLKLLGESWSPNELRQVFSKCSGAGRAANDLSRQRISIDDFVQLLL